MVNTNIINKRCLSTKSGRNLKQLFGNSSKDVRKLRLVERFERHIRRPKSRQFVHPIYQSFCKR